MDLRQRMLSETSTIAVVGLSSDPSRPSYRVARYLQSQGYRIIPVNPDEHDVLGEPAYPDLASVPFPIDMIDVFRRPQFVRAIVEEAVRLGIPRIWLQDGVIDEAAAEFARGAGVQVVMNDCTLRVHSRLFTALTPSPRRERGRPATRELMLNRSIVVITPTYNERGNLEPLVDRLRALGVPGLRMLVVDDHSPDGTGQLADGLAERFPDFVSVMHRPGKLGLGTAYVQGFRWALDQGAALVVTMDADFSHAPETLPLLVERCGEYDLAIGSRFAPGGRLDPRWGAMRRVLSWGGNSYARLLTGLPFRDVTGGFKCLRRGVLEAIDLSSIKSSGFVFQLELNYAAYRSGFQITEVPIYFAERTQGVSKMSLQIIWEAFWRVLELRTRY